MIYLIGKIIILLTLAFLVGIWLGWMTHGLHFKSRIQELQSEWASRFRSNEQEKIIVKDQHKEIMEKYAVMQKRLADTARMIKVLTQQRNAAQSKIDNDIAKINDLSGKIELLIHKIKRRDVRLKKYEHLLKALQRLEKDHKTRLQSSSETIQSLIGQMQTKSHEIEQLRYDLENISSTQHEAEDLSRDVKDRFYELQAELRDREVQLELAREQLDKQQQNSSLLEKELELIKTHVTSVPANDLSTGVHLAKQPVWLLEKHNGDKDDLKLIKGIGPVMENLLNKAGIFYFNQLARMTETDVLWISEKLKTFPKRIKNDRWQQQAVELDLDKMTTGQLDIRDRSSVTSQLNGQLGTKTKIQNTKTNEPDNKIKSDSISSDEIKETIVHDQEDDNIDDTLENEIIAETADVEALEQTTSDEKTAKEDESTDESNAIEYSQSDDDSNNEQSEDFDKDSNHLDEQTFEFDQELVTEDETESKVNISSDEDNLDDTVPMRVLTSEVRKIEMPSDYIDEIETADSYEELNNEEEFMQLSSQSFLDGQSIPGEFAFCVPDSVQNVAISDNKNPELTWANAPEGTKSFVLICVDVDVPSKPDDVNQEGREVPSDLPRADFYHWVMVDIPSNITSIAAGACSSEVTAHGKQSPDGPNGSRQGINDYTNWFNGDESMQGEYYGYDGPCPPWNDSLIHHYHFIVYATDLENCPVNGAFTGDDVKQAIEGHILDQASIVGTYTLNPRLIAD